MSGSWATPDNMVRVARRAEELGYESLWTFQRLVSPADGHWGEMYRSVHDPIVTMAYLAAHTSRVRLGVAVLNAPFVAPVILAKQLASVDVVSGGRLDVGLGAGWSAEEFAAVGADPAHRGRRVEQAVAAIRTLWTEDVDYAGTRVRMDPRPVQRPYPPILLGGTAPAALRRVGRVADGWISGSRADLATFGEAVAVARGAAQRAGRDPDVLRFVARGSVRVRPAGDPEQRLLTGTLDKIRADFDVIAQQGVTELFVDLNFDEQIASPDADPAASMARAEEVLEALAPR
ncbi:TIGR03619 family F420-dependent LLM class oxidoreductase [Phytohabitans rumicis]